MISPSRRLESSQLHTAALLRRGFFFKKRRASKGTGAPITFEATLVGLFGNDDAQYRAFLLFGPLAKLVSPSILSSSTREWLSCALNLVSAAQHFPRPPSCSFKSLSAMRGDGGAPKEITLDDNW